MPVGQYDKLGIAFLVVAFIVVVGGLTWAWFAGFFGHVVAVGVALALFSLYRSTRL